MRSAAEEEVSVAASLSKVMEQSPDGLLLLDAEWRIRYANQTARRISRIQSEHLNRETLWELYPGVLGTPLEQAYRDVARLREPRALQAFFYEPFQTWFDMCILPADDGVAVHYRDITQLREAEAGRSLVSEQLQQVFEATTDAIISLDREFRFTFLNRRARELLAPTGEAMGEVMWEKFPAADYAESPFVQTYNRAMHEGIAGEFEAYYSEPLNFWLHVSVRPSRDGIIVFFRDITAEKVKRDELRASEERYRVLTELNPQALWTADAQGLVMYANQRFLEYIGKDFVPREGTEYIECFDARDRDRVVQVWMHSVETGEEYAIDARLLCAADGASRWWHLRALPIRDSNGQIEQWLGLATDVHESRMAAEQQVEQYAEIERQKRELETIYRTAPIGLSLYEPLNLRLLRLNDRQAEILGMRPEEALGRTIEELVPGLTKSHSSLRRAAAGQQVLNIQAEGVLPTRPDDYRYWSVNYSPIFDENGSVQAVAGATIETTQQKRAETALVQSEKLAAVGRLAASISHEINNPLEAITNLLYLASTEDLSPQAQEYIRISQDELARVSQIATQTLRFHRQAQKPTMVSASQLIDAVLNLYQGRLANSGISIKTSYRDVTPITCFENDIRQVLNNLIANAIDAMRTGGRLLVRAHDVSADDVHQGMRITVADTGQGMSANTLKRLFEPFYTTKGMNGTGLGLWISQGIVQRHRGALRVRSSDRPELHGTVFSLLLPSEPPA